MCVDLDEIYIQFSILSDTARGTGSIDLARAEGARVPETMVAKVRLCARVFRG